MADAKVVPLGEVQFSTPVNLGGLKTSLLSRVVETLEYSVSDRMVRAAYKGREVLIPLENVAFMRVRTAADEPVKVETPKVEAPRPAKDDTVRLTPEDVAKAMKR